MKSKGDMEMSDVSVKSFDLSRGEGIPSFSDLWGAKEPSTFADVFRVEPLLANRMAWILNQYRKAELAVEQASRLPDGSSGDARRRSAAEQLERMRIRRDRALMDVAEMFSETNPFQSRDAFMEEVDRRTEREPATAELA